MASFKLLFTLTAIVVGLTAFALSGCASDQQGQQQSEQKSSQSSAQTYPLPGEQVFPEGIALNEATGDFFVGSTTDGTVFRGNVAEPGEEAEVFLEPGDDGRSTAIGMKIDPEGRLFIAGGDTGRMIVYDTNTGELVGSFSDDEEMTFINDVALTPDGSAYFTDSRNPKLYWVFPEGSYEFEPFLSFEGTVLEYDESLNLNGIAASEDSRYLGP